MNWKEILFWEQKEWNTIGQIPNVCQWIVNWTRVNKKSVDERNQLQDEGVRLFLRPDCLQELEKFWPKYQKLPPELSHWRHIWGKDTHSRWIERLPKT